MKFTLFLTLSVVLALAFAIPTQDAKTEESTHVEKPHESVSTKGGEHEHEHEHDSSSTTEVSKTDSTTEKSVTEKDPDHCDPGTTFQMECNMCTCTENAKRSLSACTLKLCLSPEDVKEVKEETTKTE